MLGLHGYTAVCAKDGREAVEVLDRVTPDVILLDVRMPRMDGYEFLSWLRGQGRLARIPVIVMSGTDSVPEAKVFLAKPADPLAVLAAVIAALATVREHAGHVLKEEPPRRPLADWDPPGNP